MASWIEVEAAAPDLAALVRARFEATGLGLMATLRRDGSPRISGIEPLFALGAVWMGMMEGSRKAADLRRDGRLALHSATADKQVEHGDAKLGGRAVEVVDDATFDAFTTEFRQRTGDVPPGRFPLFQIDLREISFLRPAGDHLLIQWWRADSGLREVKRS